MNTIGSIPTVSPTSSPASTNPETRPVPESDTVSSTRWRFVDAFLSAGLTASVATGLSLVLLVLAGWTGTGTSGRVGASYPAGEVTAHGVEVALHQLGDDRGGLTAATLDIYRDRGFQPIWFADGEPIESALRLADVLHRCPPASPFPSDARPKKIQAVLRWLPKASVPTPTLTFLEHSFSRAYLSCLEGTQASDGLRASAFGWSVEQPAIHDPVETFSKLLDDGLSPSELADGLERVLPPHPQVLRLADAVSRYRDIVEAEGWLTVTDGPTMEPGDEVDAERLRRLARRLQAEGYLRSAAMMVLSEPSKAPRAAAYQGPIVDSVKRFQFAHGLNSDGKVGPGTLQALNVPAHERLATLETNYHRAGWLPEPAVQGREVWVNLPAARLSVLQGGEQILDMRVVVGKRAWETPIFQEQIEYLVVHPGWNVPSSIVEHEVRHQFQSEPEKLIAQGYQVFESWRAEEPLDPFEIDWQTVDAESIHVRQVPGAANPLGRIKFAMPNENNIYLHDTSARGVFGREERSLSHGCIRVEKPVELAAALFPEDFHAVRQALDAGRRQVINVTEEATVYIVYLTAWVDEDGSVEFYPDVYQRDHHLERQVARHVAPLGPTPDTTPSGIVPARQKTTRIDVDERAAVGFGTVDAQAADEGRIPAGAPVVLDDA